MEKLEFKFNINDKVKTVFGQIGIISGLYYDEAGIQYFKEGKITLMKSTH